MSHNLDSECSNSDSGGGCTWDLESSNPGSEKSSTPRSSSSTLVRLSTEMDGNSRLRIIGDAGLARGLSKSSRPDDIDDEYEGERTRPGRRDDRRSNANMVRAINARSGNSIAAYSASESCGGTRVVRRKSDALPAVNSGRERLRGMRRARRGVMGSDAARRCMMASVCNAASCA